jgi:hypothetical protein
MKPNNREQCACCAIRGYDNESGAQDIYEVTHAQFEREYKSVMVKPNKPESDECERAYL